jgi:hypothetical protein
VQLTATGTITTRIIAQLTTISLMAVVSASLLPRFGLASTSTITAACSLPLLVIFGTSAHLHLRRIRHPTAS